MQRSLTPSACVLCSLQKPELSAEVLTQVQKLQAAGAVNKWGKALEDLPERRSTMLGELRMVGIKVRVSRLGMSTHEK